MDKKALTALSAALLVLVVSAPLAGAVTYSISVQTNASSYSGAQTMKVSGTVSPAPGSGTAVLLKVLNPSGDLLAISQASVDGSTGAYQSSFVLGGSSKWVAGTYAVNATWGNSATGPTISKTTTFSYTPAVTTTTSTTSSSTTTSTSNSTTTSRTTTTTSSTTPVTSTSTTTTPTSSSSTSSTSSTTSTQTTSSSTQGGGGIPEFPFQAAAVTLFAFLVIASYVLVRRRVMAGGIVRGP